MDLVREAVWAQRPGCAGPLLRYIFEVSEHVERDDLQGLLERELGPQAKDVMMTIGQQLREQGRQQGIEQVRQASQRVLMRLLQQRFGSAVTAQIEQRIASASLDQIELWMSRVLSAASLPELLSD